LSYYIIANFATTYLSKYSTQYLTNFSTFGNLLLDVSGTDFITSNDILVVASHGDFTPPSGSPTPPFNPAALPLSTFTGLSDELGIYVTAYFFQSALWAFSLTGTLVDTINEADIPATSPVQFKTSDPFFSQAVPGLSAYPNMDIQLTNTLTASGTVTIDSTNGVQISGIVFSQNWQLYNSSTTLDGWSLKALFEGDVTLTASIVNGQVLLYSQLMSDSANVTVTATAVGNVSAVDFEQLFSLVSAILPKINFTVPLPSEFVANSVTLQECDGYVDLEADFTFIVPSNDTIKCGSYSCAAENTCCGNSFCCADEQGTCCSNYCCPQGLICVTGGCNFPSSSSSSSSSGAMPSRLNHAKPGLGRYKKNRTILKKNLILVIRKLTNLTLLTLKKFKEDHISRMTNQ